MTPEAAFVAWLGTASGLPVHPEGHVPADASYPYATFSLPVSGFGDGDAAASVSLWYRNSGEAVPNACARKLSAELGLGGKLLACDGGAMWLKRGEPFSQPMADTDDAIERRLINISVEYFI